MPRKQSDVSSATESVARRTRSSSRTPSRKQRSLSELTMESVASKESIKRNTTRRRGKSRDSTGESSVVQEDAVESESTPVKPEPTVNVAVHRIRHLHYQPPAIITMSASDTFVAVSREDKTIDIRLVQASFRILTTVVCPVVVTALVWVNNVLVGACDEGYVFVVDIEERTCHSVTPSDGGGVLCLAAHGDVVAAGCQDGTVRFFGIDAVGDLQLQIIVPTMGAPVLSVAWNSTTLYAGVADGTIRRYDRTDSTRAPWKSTFRMTVENMGRNIPTRVWSLLLLDNGTVVSGDSLGHVQFWDGMSGTLLQSFPQNDNKADVLSLGISVDQTKIFASGVDSRVVCLARLPHDVPGTDSVRPWTLSHAQRPHTHDVRAVCVVEPQPGKELVCTGGVDTKFCTYSVNRFAQQRPRVVYPWPVSDVVHMAKEKRVLYMIRGGNNIDFFHLAPGVEPDSLNVPVLVSEDSTRFGSVKVSGMKHIVCSSITDDGSMLAVTDQRTLLIFALGLDDTSGSMTMKPRKMQLELPTKKAIASIHLTQRKELIGAFMSGDVFVSSPLSDSDGDGNVNCTWSGPLRCSAGVLHAVSKILSTDDTHIIATISPGLSGSVVDVFTKDAFGELVFYWRLPNVGISQHAVAFLPGEKPMITVASVDFEPLVFDLEKKALSEWSRDSVNGKVKLPIELHARRDHPIRITVDPTDSSKFLVHSLSGSSLVQKQNALFPPFGSHDNNSKGSFGAFVAFDMSKPYPTQCSCFPEKHVRVGKKRKRKMSVSEKSADTRTDEPFAARCVLCLRYNSMLCLDYLNANEMVIVEQPWTSVVSALPEALERKVYGS